MNMRAILVILAAATLAACTPMAWVKDDTAPEQQNKDLANCQRDAFHEARANTWYYRPIGPYMGGGSGRFVISPGAPYYDPFYDPYLEEARLTQFCMKNKGYELKPVEPGKSTS
jgi:hypothetical protein